MRIGVDAMGGDHAPREIIHGVRDGLKFLGPDDELLVYGPREVVEGQFREAGLTDPRARIEHCTQIIAMGESPLEALRTKRDSTLVRMASAAGKGELDAIISAGNTGAFAAAAQLRIKPIEGVSRPGIAVTLPTFAGPVLVCDVGANVAPKPHHLIEYARMSTIYAQRILGVPEPKVGLVSIGEEEAKGNSLVKEAHQLLKDDPEINFVGNCEGRDIFAGAAHVFVCDGFVGNVVLKLTEGLAEGLFQTIFKEIEAEGPGLARQFQPVCDRIWARHDFAEYGGAPLLGIKSVVIICHGRSDRRALSNGVRVAAEQIRVNLTGLIEAKLNARGIRA